MRRASPDHRPGISLLEVLGATAIFLLSIIAISELMSLSTEQAIEVQFRSRATRLCQSKLNEFAAGVETLNGATGGEFEEDADWRWSAEVASDSSALNLYRVTVTVSRATEGRDVQVSMTQIIYDPLQRGQLTGSSTTAGGGESTTPGGTTPGTTGGSTGSKSGSTGGTNGGAGGGKGGTGGSGGGKGGGGKGGGGGGGKR